MTKRLSPRLNITLQPLLVERLNETSARLGMRRGTIIQQALREWLEKNRPPDPIRIVGGKLFDKTRDIRYYLRDDMGPDEMMQTLEEFEAARKPK